MSAGGNVETDEIACVNADTMERLAFSRPHPFQCRLGGLRGGERPCFLCHGRISGETSARARFVAHLRSLCSGTATAGRHRAATTPGCRSTPGPATTVTTADVIRRALQG